LSCNILEHDADFTLDTSNEQWSSNTGWDEVQQRRLQQQRNKYAQIDTTQNIATRLTIH